MLTYCFESEYVPRTFARCRKNDLTVVDTDPESETVMAPEMIISAVATATNLNRRERNNEHTPLL